MRGSNWNCTFNSYVRGNLIQDPHSTQIVQKWLATEIVKGKKSTTEADPRRFHRFAKIISALYGAFHQIVISDSSRTHLILFWWIFWLFFNENSLLKIQNSISQCSEVTTLHRTVIAIPFDVHVWHLCVPQRLECASYRNCQAHFFQSEVTPK